MLFGQNGEMHAKLQFFREDDGQLMAIQLKFLQKCRNWLQIQGFNEKKL
jgi:hypothetical protein